MFGQEKAIGRMTVQSITRTMPPHDPGYSAAGPYFVAGSFFSRSSARFFSVSSSLDFGMSST